MGPNVFISYRRSDTETEAEELYKKLGDRFGFDRVFFDRHSLPLGENFAAYLGYRISMADVILILMGPAWHGGKGRNHQFRIAEKDDYVRKEVRYSLLRHENEKVPVIPVLVGVSDFNSFWIPEELMGLKMLNACFVPNTSFDSRYDGLVEKMAKVPIKDRGAIQTPNVLEQEVRIGARENLWGGLRHPFPLPSDSYALVEKVGKKWRLEIRSKGSPRFNLNRFSIPIGDFEQNQFAEVFGKVMEWYELPRDRWLVKKVEKTNSLFGSLVGKQEGFEWVDYLGNAAYSILYFLILDFEALYVNEEIGRADTLIGFHAPIGEGYAVFGLLGDLDRRVFGKYVCSLTTEMGARSKDDGRLYYFPSFPGTGIHYVDLTKSPQFEDVVYCGHVGLDRNGYHIYFVP